jgi:hypothetical protein
VRIIESRKIKWDNCVTDMGEFRTILKILAREPE